MLTSVADRLPKYLLDGQSVELGEIGSLRITFSSEEVLSEDEFTPAKIDQLKIHFLAGPHFKKIVKQAGFERP